MSFCLQDNRIVIFNVVDGVSATSAKNTAPPVSVFLTNSVSKYSIFPSTDDFSLLSTDIFSSSSSVWMSTGSLYTTSTLSTSLLPSVSPTTTGTSGTNNENKSPSLLSAQSFISPSPSIIVSALATSQINYPIPPPTPSTSHRKKRASALNTQTSKTDRRFKIICQQFKNGYIKNVIDLLEVT